MVGQHLALMSVFLFLKLGPVHTPTTRSGRGAGGSRSLGLPSIGTQNPAKGPFG